MADTAIKQIIAKGIGPTGCGITNDGYLVNNGRFVGPSAISKIVRYEDDFLGDVIADQWNVVEGADTTTSNALVVNGPGGQCDLITGDSATLTYAGNGIQITHGQFFNWKASNGGLRFETRLKLDAITLVAFFAGFTDLGTFEAPIESAGSANTITTTASDAVGFFFDTRMTDDKIWIAGVKADADATHQNTTIAPVAATYIVLAFEVDTDGTATFYINGNRVGTPVLNAVTASTVLTPTVVATSLETASKTISVDYVQCEMHRS